MKISSTSNNDLTFVESLYKQLRKDASKATQSRDKMIAKANNYLEDGATESECVELLIIDGIGRQSAESYVQLAKNNSKSHLGDDSSEYNFQFEDIYGKLWSSYDIHKVVYASNDRDAWELAEELIFSDPSIEPERVVSVDRIS